MYRSVQTVTPPHPAADKYLLKKSGLGVDWSLSLEDVESYLIMTDQ